MMKPCVKCGSTERNKWGHCMVCDRRRSSMRYHSLSEEGKRANNQKSYQSDKAGRCAQTKAWAESNPDKREEIMERSRLKKYGLTIDQYKSILVRQDGKCAICGDTLGCRVHIDHDHVTGLVRGILCQSCNVGLGHFRDNSMILREAASYLEVDRRDVGLFVTLSRSPYRAGDARFKVTDEVLEEMKSLKCSGLSFGAVAKKLGLSRSWVYLTLKKETH